MSEPPRFLCDPEDTFIFSVLLDTLDLWTVNRISAEELLNHFITALTYYSTSGITFEYYV
jgi:hypothetical protein